MGLWREPLEDRRDLGEMKPPQFDDAMLRVDGIDRRCISSAVVPLRCVIGAATVSIQGMEITKTFAISLASRST